MYDPESELHLELYSDMKLTDIANLPGVADLKMTVKAPFIRALRLEERGDHAGAAIALDKAVDAEEALAVA